MANRITRYLRRYSRRQLFANAAIAALARLFVS
jgi:hypothetical protein